MAGGVFAADETASAAHCPSGESSPPSVLRATAAHMPVGPRAIVPLVASTASMQELTTRLFASSRSTRRRTVAGPARLHTQAGVVVVVSVLVRRFQIAAGVVCGVGCPWRSRTRSLVLPAMTGPLPPTKRCWPSRRSEGSSYAFTVGSIAPVVWVAVSPAARSVRPLGVTSHVPRTYPMRRGVPVAAMK